MSRLPHLARILAPLAVAAAVSASPGAARACGGLFCGVRPVDQTAEHILFTMNPGGTITVHVQIQYAGDRDDFAWIVPVPAKPELTADFPPLAFQALDLATGPQYSKNSCTGGGIAFGAGCPNCGPVPAALDAGGVTVIARQDVGPYSTVTLEGASAEVIVQWLQDNGFRITDKMIPFIQPYVADGMKFVAMALQPDQDVTDIKPLSMTYPGDKPMIPIRLTTVAAQPEMGIVAWVLAERRYAPDNYVDLEIPDSLIEFDQWGQQSNYLKLVSAEADKVGGQAFVTEYAKATPELAQSIRDQFVNPDNTDGLTARDTLAALLDQYPFLTRLYARMSAEEMNLDPTFIVASDTSEVDNVHDLTEPGFDYSQCQYPLPTPEPTDPCFLTYCGRSGACTSASVTPQGATEATDIAACVCANDATARPTTTTNGNPSVYCEPVAMNLDGAEASAAAGGPLLVAACEGFGCGAHGECIPMNGNPTCRCEAGYGATVSQEYDSATGTATTRVSCERVENVPAMPVLPAIGQRRVTSGGGGGDTSASAGCTLGPTRPRSGAAALPGLFALLSLALLRRRR